ncbi:MAG: glycosyltransferase family 4 protein [Pyrinomonadaceae bacterium]
MRVMHILDSLNRGGAEMLALDLCRNARSNNLDLTFVATGGGDLEADFRNSGVIFQRLQRRLPVDLRLAGRIGRIIKEREIDVVHTHQAVEALHAYLATRGGRVKRVMTFHLCTSDAKNKVALNLLAPRMDANVAVSRELLKCLEHEAGFNTGDRFHVVHNGVDHRRLEPTGANLRAELGLNDGALVLGMIGNFYPDGRKDQVTICRALPRVFAEVPAAHFLFIGGSFPAASQLLQECVALCRELGISERVHFLGKRSDIPDLLSSLDVYVQSSVNESLGIAVIEAMLTGLPVVVSDIGALLEVTGEGEYAVTFRTGDAAELADKLIELCHDEHRRGELAGMGKAWATSHFSIEAHIASLITLYNQIC